ncbi:MAG: hypothetical protein LBO66_10050 [Deltaproteobacteria bacterium]|nr:hypothetical protein [Deltaproteobacteria bacterium]
MSSDPPRRDQEDPGRDQRPHNNGFKPDVGRPRPIAGDGEKASAPTAPTAPRVPGAPKAPSPPRDPPPFVAKPRPRGGKRKFRKWARARQERGAAPAAPSANAAPAARPRTPQEKRPWSKADRKAYHEECVRNAAKYTYSIRVKKHAQKPSGQRFYFYERPSKTIRTIIAHSHPELLEKAKELQEWVRINDPEEYARVESKTPAALDALYRKSDPDLTHKDSSYYYNVLKNWGFPRAKAEAAQVVKSYLRFKYLFADFPIESMSDDMVAANLRLLFLAFRDYIVPIDYAKFREFIRDRVCEGISEGGLERVMKILREYGFFSMERGNVTVCKEYH